MTQSVYGESTDLVKAQPRAICGYCWSGTQAWLVEVTTGMLLEGYTEKPLQDMVGLLLGDWGR